METTEQTTPEPVANPVPDFSDANLAILNALRDQHTNIETMINKRGQETVTTITDFLKNNYMDKTDTEAVIDQKIREALVDRPTNDEAQMMINKSYDQFTNQILQQINTLILEMKVLQENVANVLVFGTTVQSNTRAVEHLVQRDESHQQHIAELRAWQKETSNDLIVDRKTVHDIDVILRGGSGVIGLQEHIRSQEVSIKLIPVMQAQMTQLVASDAERRAKEQAKQAQRDRYKAIVRELLTHKGFIGAVTALGVTLHTATTDGFATLRRILGLE